MFYGPRRLPSEYLEDLESKGYTILDGVLSEDAVEHLKAVIAAIRRQELSHRSPFDGRMNMPHLLDRTHVVARALVHPVALWIIQSYLGHEMQFAHPPAVTVLRPARRLLEKPYAGGWHEDYPYLSETTAVNREQLPRIQKSLEEAGYPAREIRRSKLGVQFNICVDAFCEGNGATQFILDSFRKGKAPPAELNNVVTRAGVGVHRNVVQLEAEKGAAIIYDARMHHRACPELNRSGQDRIAILNAAVPKFVYPKHPIAYKAPSYRSVVDAFGRSSLVARLTAREVRDVKAMVGDPPKGLAKL